jgi:hypothetical protein
MYCTVYIIVKAEVMSKQGRVGGKEGDEIEEWERDYVDFDPEV